jgi:Holliday junction resolvase RusA-like endonuclease
VAASLVRTFLAATPSTRTARRSRLPLKPPDMKPTEDAVSVWLTFTFSRPKSHMTKRGVKKTAPALPREDVDNLAKAVLDALTCHAWHDDKQVAELHVSKSYGTAGSTEVTIEQLS